MLPPLNIVVHKVVAVELCFIEACQRTVLQVPKNSPTACLISLFVALLALLRLTGSVLSYLDLIAPLRVVVLNEAAGCGLWPHKGKAGASYLLF